MLRQVDSRKTTLSLAIVFWIAIALMSGCGRTALRDATSSEDAGTSNDAAAYADVGLPDDPTDDELLRTSFFHEPLALVGGASTLSDNRALARAIRTDLARRDRYTTDALDEFVRAHPATPWRASLLVNLGILYREIGRYRRALDVWEEAYALTRAAPGADARSLRDRAASELALLNAQLGRKSRLDDLAVALRDRPPLGPAADRYARAQIGRATMEAHPERAFRCGPLAVASVWDALHPREATPAGLRDATSSPQGTSLAQLVALSAAAREPMRAMQRAPGTAWAIPSVVHWRVDHFAALVGVEREASGRRVYVLRDPTFGREMRTTERWLEDEASGYVLVPARTAVPPSWRDVPSAEAETVWGRGETSDTDPDAWSDDDQVGTCGDSRRMARYGLHAHLAALRVEDTPAWLNPSFGPAVDLRIVYNQADWSQPQTPKYTNFGGRWTFNFGSALTGTREMIAYAYNGGGTRRFPRAVTALFSIDARSGDRLEDVPGYPDDQILRHRDGSSDRFRLLEPGFVTRWYLVERRDPQGNAATLEYDSNRRLTVIRAASGETLTFYYRTEAYGAEYYLVDHVELSDGRTANFSYTTRDPNGRLILSGIADMGGIESTFNYTETARGYADGGTVPFPDHDFLSSLKTPYGSTGFRTGWAAQLSGGPGMGRYLQRWLEVDLPTGEHERVEFRQVADANQQADCYGLAPCTFRDESEVVPPAVNGALNDNADAGDAGPAYAPDNAVFLNFRNSYHWNPVGYARGRTEGSTGPVFDPRHAHVYHWSHQPASFSLTAPLLESEVPPGESRVTYVHDGQISRQMLPTLDAARPWFRRTVSARLTVDGDASTEQFTRIAYSADGNPREVRDVAGRVRCLTWAGNGIDLLAVHARPCGSGSSSVTETDSAQRLERMEYEGDLHLPVRFTDAAGQVTRYVYNLRGQVLRVVRPDGRAADVVYDQGSSFAGAAEPGVTPTEGRPLQVRFPTAGVPTGTPVTTTVMTWHPHGTLASLTDTEGVLRSFAWDDIERLTTVTALGGRVESYDYRLRNENGDIATPQTGLEATRITLANGDTITRSYDAQHRLIRVAVGPTDVVRYRYNRMGAGQFDLVQKLRGDDNNDLVTRWSAGVAPPVSPGTRQGFVLPLFQQRPTLRVRVASNEVSTWARDGIGRVVAATDGWHSWSAFYNPDGTIARVCDGSPCTATSTSARTEFRYEPQVGDASLTSHMRRLRFVSRFSGGAVAEHEQETQYVPFGMAGALRTFSVREASVGDATTQNVTYGYDVLGRVLTATSPALPGVPAETITRRFDDLDRLDLITSSAYPGQDLSRLVYLAGQTSARPTAEEMPVHGCRATFGYTLTDHDMLPNQRSVRPTGSSTEILGFEQSFDARNRVASERIATGTRHYAYDPSFRLMWADDFLSGSWLYRDNYYDNPGNQGVYSGYLNGVSLFSDGILFNGYDRAWQRDRLNRPTVYIVHDVRGRLTFDGDYTYTWDQNDRLTQVERATDSATWQFRYDGAGRLRRFQEGGLWHRLVWVDGQLYSEHTGTSEGNETTLLRTYHVDGMTQYAGSTGTRYRIERDIRGSVRALVHNGQVAHAWRYDPWGLRSDDGGPVSGVEPRRGFAGYVVHAETGLAFTPSRVYQPALRRWLTRDPLGERVSVDGNNLYAYAANDPINNVDPNGQWVENINAQSLGNLSNYFGGVGDAMSFGFGGALREVLGIDGEVNECSGLYATGTVAGGLAAALITGGAGGGPTAMEPTISLFHGSIRDGAAITRNGLSTARGTTYVTRDIAAARDALANHYEAVRGLGSVVESRVPQSLFESMLAHLERPYQGFHPYRLSSSEIPLRTAEQIELFNRFIVR